MIYFASMMFQLLLLFFYGFIQLAKAQDSSSLCPNVTGWTFNHESSTCFFLGDTLVNHDEAQAFCASKGGILAEIRDKYHHSELIKSSQPLFVPPWTGAKRGVDKFTWPDGTDIGNYWGLGEPSKNGDCTVFRVPLNVNDSGLTTAPCSDIQYPLCTYRPKICEGVVTIQGESGTFTSPNYPNNYYNDVTCVWLLVAPVNTSFISLIFDDYDVHGYPDYIILYEGNTTDTRNYIHYYLGHDLSEKNTYDSIGNMMTVLFRTDANAPNKGFKASFIAVPNYPEIRQTGTSGDITSLNYPNNYPDLVHQNYYIEGPPGTLISIQIDDFNTEPNVDRVDMYCQAEPDSDERILLMSASGHIFAHNLTAGSEKVWMTFRSDRNINLSGFHMKWIAYEDDSHA